MLLFVQFYVWWATAVEVTTLVPFKVKIKDYI